MSDNFEHGARVSHPPAEAGLLKLQTVHDAEVPPGDDEDSGFEPLTREQAQALLAKHPPLSPWRVVTVQAVAGLVVTALIWALTQDRVTGLSALYGAATGVLPQALLARGMSRLPTVNVRAAALGFMVWEMVKLALAIGMLVAARYVVPGLSWPALLVALVVCLKASWLALLIKRRRPG